MKGSQWVGQMIFEIQYNKIIGKDVRMELRSKSAQQRRHDREYQQLQAKLNWVLTENCQPPNPNLKQDHSSRQPKNHRFHHPPTRHPIRKVESIENVQLAKIHTAIGELQQLVAHTPTEGQEEVHCPVRDGREANAESYVYEEGYPSPLRRQEDRHILGRMNQTMEYYKQENGKLRDQLAREKQINGQCAATIKKLQQANHQLEKEIHLLLHRYKADQSNCNRVRELEGDLKGQVVINLELEQLLLKEKKRREERDRKELDEQHYKRVIEDLREQMEEKSKAKDSELALLRQVIQDKDQEIKSLKQLKAQPKNPQLPITLRDIPQPSPPQQPPNYIQRFLNFSKQMQAKISFPQNFVSTHPSLQDINDIHCDYMRKKSGSVSSKGNCLSLAMPALEIRTTTRVSSKTDRL